MTRVLLVDDSSAMRAFARAVLEDAGDPDEPFLVTEATNGFDAMRLLPRSDYDLVITDINMPVQNGIALIKALRDQDNFVPIIAMTGFGDIQTAVAAVKAGAAEFVEKPFDNEAFLELIRNLLQSNPGAEQNSRGNLTEVEKLVLHDVAIGMSNKEIATALNRSVRTIENHRQRIAKKLGTDSMADLVKMALKLGLGGKRRT